MNYYGVALPIAWNQWWLHGVAQSWSLHTLACISYIKLAPNKTSQCSLLSQKGIVLTFATTAMPVSENELEWVHVLASHLFYNYWFCEWKFFQWNSMKNSFIGRIRVNTTPRSWFNPSTYPRKFDIHGAGQSAHAMVLHCERANKVKYNHSIAVRSL